jgi:hypothetical protein
MPIFNGRLIMVPVGKAGLGRSVKHYPTGDFAR